MTKLQESLILLMVAVRRMRNRAVGVLNLHLRSSKSFFFPPAVSSVMEWEQAEKSNLYFCLILLLFWLQIPWSHNLFVQFHKPSVLYKLSPFTPCSQSPWMLLPVSYHMCSVCQNSLLLCWYLTWFWIETTVVEFRPELLTAGSLCVILKCCSEN